MSKQMGNLTKPRLTPEIPFFSRCVGYADFTSKKFSNGRGAEQL